MGAGGAAFAAYVDGELVIDLWKGLARPDQEWTQDTVSTLFSTTKALTATCALVLVDRGLLDVDAPVSRYWPEFAAAGKESALVRHTLTHTVGVLGVPDASSLLHVDGRGWDDYDAIAERLAASSPEWDPGTRNSYHAISIGWLIGELVRRVDGRTIGEFFQQEVARPLGLDLWIGTPTQVQEERATEMLEMPTDGLPGMVLEMQGWLARQTADPDRILGRQAIAIHGTSIINEAVPFFGGPAGRTPEQAGAGGVGSARGLARMFAALADGGELDGTRIATPATIELFRREYVSGPAEALRGLTLPDGTPFPPVMERWGLGFMVNLKDPMSGNSFGPDDDAFGHSGMGGQVALADPHRRVAVGFVRSEMSMSWAGPDSVVSALYQAIS